MDKQKKEKYHYYRYISNIKTISLLMVILWHSSLFYEENLYFPESSGIIYPPATFVGRIHDVTLIATFVFASGFLFALIIGHHRSVFGMLLERIRRLLIPYLLCGCLWLVPLYTFFDIKAFGRPPGAGYAQGYVAMLLGQFSDHLWFLLMLFWVTLFFLILSPLIKRNMYLVTFIITVAAAVCTDLFLADFPYYKLSQISSYLICFYAGILFYSFADRLESLSVPVLLAISAAMFAVVLCNPIFNPSHFVFKYIFRCAGALFMCFLFMSLERADIWTKIENTTVYEYLVTHSMDFYLLNMPFPYLFFRLYRGVLGENPPLCILVIFVSSFVAITLSVMVLDTVRSYAFGIWARSKEKRQGKDL